MASTVSTIGLVKNMPHPRVVEMRRRLAEIHKLAEEAARAVGYGKVERLLDKWAEGKMTTRELVGALKRLARNSRE